MPGATTQATGSLTNTYIVGRWATTDAEVGLTTSQIVYRAATAQATASLATTQLTFAPPEVYTAKFTTSLTAPITSGLRPTTISVAATQQAYGQGTFSIAIFDAGTDTNPVNFEALEVIGGGASTTWNVVTENGWAPLTHASGSTVIATVFTPRSIQQPLVNHVTPLNTPDPHSIYIKKSVFSAIGQILVGIGNGAFTNLPVGSNGQNLVADSTRTGGVKWATTSIASVLQHLGDMLVGGVGGAATRLGIGNVGQILQVVRNPLTVADPILQPSISWTNAGGTLFAGQDYDFQFSWSTGTSPDGGETLGSPIATSTATGDTAVVQCPAAPAVGATLLVYANFNGSPTRLQATLPNASTTLANTVLVGNIANVAIFTSGLNTTGGISPAWTSALGTVTSVALAVPTDQTVTAPITTAGTIVVSDSHQPQNTFKAGPTGGGNGPPSWRGISQADIPLITRSDEITAPDFKSTGITGATSGARFVGATVTGPPTGSNPFLQGDFVIDRSGTMWVCTAGGFPGTWAGPGVPGGRLIGFTPLRATASMSAVSLGSIAPYTVIQDQKSAGTDGGTFTSGADQTRVLNTIVTDTASLATLASNQITLPKGIYRIKATLPARAVGVHRGWLFDTTHSTTLINGQNAYADSASNVQNDALIDGMFILTSTSVLEIRHRCGTTGTTTGFGTSLNGTFTVPVEIYTTVEIWKLGG